MSSGALTYHTNQETGYSKENKKIQTQPLHGQYARVVEDNTTGNILGRRALENVIIPNQKEFSSSRNTGAPVLHLSRSIFWADNNRANHRARRQRRQPIIARIDGDVTSVQLKQVGKIEIN